MESIDFKSMNLTIEESRDINNFIAQKRGISTKKLLSTIKPNLKCKNNEILTTKTTKHGKKTTRTKKITKNTTRTKKITTRTKKVIKNTTRTKKITKKTTKFNKITKKTTKFNKITKKTNII